MSTPGNDPAPAPTTATAGSGGGNGARPVAGALFDGHPPPVPPTPPAPPIAAAGDDWLSSFIGLVVVADLDDQYIVVGTLTAVAPDHLAFANADLHDHRESNSTKDVYVIESRKIGVRVNRHKLWIPRHRLVALSPLADVVM
jgi:hypothetical protein